MRSPIRTNGKRQPDIRSVEKNIIPNLACLLARLLCCAKGRMRKADNFNALSVEDIRPVYYLLPLSS